MLTNAFYLFTTSLLSVHVWAIVVSIKDSSEVLVMTVDRVVVIVMDFMIVVIWSVVFNGLKIMMLNTVGSCVLNLMPK